MSSLSAVFGKPPKEAVKFFDKKKLLLTEGWEEVEAIAHQQSFVVAQTAGFNVLADIQQAIKQARDQGWSHKQFQQELEPILKSKGWWGKAVDPKTGEILKTYPGTNRPVQYGSPARIRLIYDANMSSSYAAGRRERQLATITAFPYWRYLAVRDGRTRPAHAKLNGKIWRADASIWSSIYPPNGFRCRCTVQAVNSATAKREGVEDDGVMVENIVTVNKNGDTMKVRGVKFKNGRVFYPDPNWDIAPGLKSNLAKSYDLLGDSLTRLSSGGVPVAINSMMKSGGVFEVWRKNPVGNFPLVVLSESSISKIGSKERVGKISPETISKQEIAHPELSNKEYTLTQKTVDEGIEIQDSKTTLAFILDDISLKQVVVVKATKTGNSVFVTSVRRLSTDTAKKDAEIRRLKSKVLK